MARVVPFRALRPNADHVEDVVCLPYDVISTAEARAMAEGKPGSFLHVIRPEIAFAPGFDEHADEVYAQGASALRACASSGRWTDAPAALYVYRLTMAGRDQIGVFGCVSVEEYDAGDIVRHEKTRVDKEDDRTRHILTQRAHAEPVMLTYRDDAAVTAIVDATISTAPLYDLDGPHDVRHTIWEVADSAGLARAFEAVERLYVADGHHRCKAASRAAAALREPASAESRVFPAVVFPMSAMHVMAYNRVARVEAPDAFFAALEAIAPLEEGAPQPPGPGAVSVYDGRGWRTFSLPDAAGGAVRDALDVARLQDHVLAPLLGIDDPRTSERVAFVGGIRGTDALERLVDAGDWDVAFSMHPTSIAELLDVSDAGELMPPKSTWFEPKLLSGFLAHRF